jgi:hypothetical protein
MARISDVYSGDFATAAELVGKGRVVAQITKAEVESIGQDQAQKVVLSLASRAGVPWPRRVVLNKTNGLILASAYGDETDAWIGRQIEVWAEPVSYQGRIVQGIRLAPQIAGNGAAPQPGAPMPGMLAMPVAPQSAPPLVDDDIPF